MKFLAILFFLPNIAFAQNEITIRGKVDCGQWISARTTNTAAYYETAIQGFINGLAMGSRIDIWNGGGSRMSEQQAYLYIDNYCKNKPLDDMWQAGWALANEKTNNALINQFKSKK